MLRSFVASFRNKNGVILQSALRLMSGGDVVAPPSEYDSSISVDIINNQQDAALMIDSYSPIGFLLNNGSRVVGPCAIFPRSILHWNVAEAADITEESLTLFTMLEPKIDILVIGKGEREGVVDEQIIHFLRTHKINVEILPTDQACSTFNFLNSERRLCAAALIPPAYVDQYSDDIIEIEAKDEVYKLRSDFGSTKYPLPDGMPPGIKLDEIISHGSRKMMDVFRKSSKPDLPLDAKIKPPEIEEAERQRKELLKAEKEKRKLQAQNPQMRVRQLQAEKNNSGDKDSDNKS